ncbi:hypothetical protein RHGRI_001340 [Rhododendron griersonianum]|uniref:Uncharacterized protein n=1 Tax=Rhododendron griersonianum TaxID=479676 RepID=A0AAV6LK81_9ERIC|nr:hypothetical protein RHGRI_001340 [Rhododendron griersonianum]
MPELAMPKMNWRMKSNAIDEEDEDSDDVVNKKRDLHRRHNMTPELPPSSEMKGTPWNLLLHGRKRARFRCRERRWLLERKRERERIC